MESFLGAAGGAENEADVVVGGHEIALMLDHGWLGFGQALDDVSASMQGGERLVAAAELMER